MIQQTPLADITLLGGHVKDSSNNTYSSLKLIDNSQILNPSTFGFIYSCEMQSYSYSW